VLPDPAELAAIKADIAEVTALRPGHSVDRDSFADTAVLTADQAAGLGRLGYIPRTAYQRTDGDVMSRFLARAEEIGSAVTFTASAVGRLDGQLGTAPAGRVPAPAAGRQGRASPRGGAAASCTASRSLPTVP
jgi:hypothetical protein